MVFLESKHVVLTHNMPPRVQISVMGHSVLPLIELFVGWLAIV